ncbi:MAG: DnaJ domain-containing protein [Thermodesulfovibrionales bacterium]|nr:DnaJ domain-containing protein [Thermodesulfovibrionales bacterium]
MAENAKDKRHFLRRRKKLDFDLKVGGKSFKAETVDYSVGGVGVSVEDSPPVKVGDILYVEIPQSSLKFQGRVTRSEKSNGMTRLGISRLSPYEGLLKDFRLSDVLIGLQRGGRTGVLDITNVTEWKILYLDGGDVVFASSNLDSDRMGNILFKEGRITGEQHGRACELMKMTGQREGAALVQLGYLKPTELPWAVKHQIEKIIERLFSLTEGRFEFRETTLPKDEVITLKLSMANLIYRGIKAIENSDRIADWCPPPDSVLAFSSNPLDLFQDVKLDDADRRILSYVDGKTTVKDILSMARREEKEAMRSVYALISTRIIDVREPEEEAEISSEEVLEEQKEDASELTERIERLYEEHETLGYYGVLGVKASSPNAEIKRAYYRMAKEFHPDRHYRLPADMKHKLNKLFSYITTAYSTLTNTGRRKEYDMSLTLKPERLGSSAERAAKKFEEAKGEMKRYRVPEALKLFAEAAYLDSSMSEYHFHYGIALGRLDRYREAERSIARALRGEPFNADYLAEAGHIFLNLDMPVRARGSFEKALKVQPSNARAKEGLAKLNS